jgi:membrane associated rhomboid family serine protease
MWLDWLEKRFGHWSVAHFPLFIVAANGIIYLLGMTQPGFTGRLLLDPVMVRFGEWWRVMTFLFVPPSMGPFWLVFWLLLLYQYSQALEYEWGSFRFLVFYVIGALATVVASLWSGQSLSNLPLNTVLFLAFATLFPDFQLLLFFVIPIKVKYLAWVFWAGIIYSLVFGGAATRVGVIASLVNYAIFFGPGIWNGLRIRWLVYNNRKRFR